MNTFFLGLDTADIKEISKRAGDDTLFSVRHVTTNPSLLRKIGEKISWEKYKKLALQISEVQSIKYVSAEASGYDKDKQGYSADLFLKEGREILSWGEKILVKIPATDEGFKAIARDKELARKTNVTLVFNIYQALKAADLGVFCISPFIGRLDDRYGNGSGIKFIEQIATEWKKWNIRETKILAASIRNIEYVKKSLEFGCEMLTMPPLIYDKLREEIDEKLKNDPLLIEGLEKFLKDWLQN